MVLTVCEMTDTEYQRILDGPNVSLHSHKMEQILLIRLICLIATSYVTFYLKLIINPSLSEDFSRVIEASAFPPVLKMLYYYRLQSNPQKFPTSLGTYINSSVGILKLPSKFRLRMLYASESKMKTILIRT